MFAFADVMLYIFFLQKIFDFALTDEEMKRINGMDKNKRVYQLIEYELIYFSIVNCVLIFL